MGSWINRTVLSGASTARNGTTSHTCTFTPATAGNFLVAVVAGAVTFTTPSGWTRTNFAVGNSGLYLFTKTASGGESSFTTTHNGSNYPIFGVIYEFYTGTAILNSANAATQANTVTGPAVTGLTGTYTRMAARSYALGSTTDTASTSWTTPTTEDYDDYLPNGSGTDGCTLTIAYDDGETASSYSPSSTLTTASAGGGEAVAFALSVVAPPNAAIFFPWIKL